MIAREEIAHWAQTWGVPEAQVVKDHVISHLLHALEGTRGIVFFGGTALNRTYVADRRVSEDVDLYVDPADPTDVEAVLDRIARGTRKELPDLRITFVGRQHDVRTFEAAVDTTRVRVQLVGPRHEYERFPTATGSIRLRFTDLPPTIDLTVPSIHAFAAMKCHAYEDRHAPRDLFDLDSLEAVGAITDQAVAILRDVRGHGPVLAQYADATAPTPDEWTVELSHQTSSLGDPLSALDRVRRSLESATSPSNG